MSDLRDERLRRLHTQFLDASQKYSLLRHAAAGNRDSRGSWPEVPSGEGDFYLGVPEWEWRSLLLKERSDSFVPFSTHWLRIGGELWNGAFFLDGPLDVKLLLRLNESEREKELGITEFRQLAARSAGFFAVEPVPADEHERMLRMEASARWLEILYSLPFVEVDDSHSFFVKKLPGDLFSASAQPIEHLVSNSSAPAERVEHAHSDSGLSISTGVARLFARRAWHILAAVHRASPPYRDLLPDQLGRLMHRWLRDTSRELEQHGPVFRETIQELITDQPYQLSGVWGKSCHEAVWKLLDKLVNSAWNIGVQASLSSGCSPEDGAFLETRWLLVATALAAIPLFNLEKVEAELQVEAARLRRQLAAGKSCDEEMGDPQQFRTIRSITESPRSEPRPEVDREARRSAELYDPPSADPPGAPAGHTPFSGGQMVFFLDRVELCEVDICSGLRSQQARKVLNLLRKRRKDGTFVAYNGNKLAEKIGHKRGQNGAVWLIRDLRTRISEALRNKANIECRRDDVILSGGRGYRLSEKLSVLVDHDGGGALDQGHGSEMQGGNVPDRVPNDSNPDDPNVPDDEAEARRNWIIQKLGQGRKLRAPDIERELDCSLKTAKRDLKSLKDEGRIEFVGTRRTGHYRLKKGTKPR